jgi:type I restriction-modification system DNA methylase subunit
VCIKAIDPDIFLDEIKPIDDLKSIIEMVVKEERRIKESSEFIDYLKEKHNEIEVFMEKRLLQKLEDKKFEEKIRKFLAPIGMSYNTSENIPTETLKMLSMQATYLLIDKILFYYLIIENKENLRKGFDDKEIFDKIFIELEKEPPISEELDKKWSKEFWIYLESLFKLVQDIDYEPIFSTKNSPLNEINLDEYPHASYYLKELMEYLYGKEKLSNLFDGPLLSKIYEGLIPSDLRWKWGQIYTPPEITRLIAEWAIRDPNDLVLDPACGTGRFLISAYERLMKLKGESLDKIHQDLLYQIRGIDINQFPAHLATMSLAAMNLNSITRKVNIDVMDFLLFLEGGQSIFNPDEIRVHLAGQTEFGNKGKLVGQTAFSSDRKIDDPIGLVDAIIMNPPYTRQEALP